MKMQVGDIEMDSETGIDIDGREVTRTEDAREDPPTDGDGSDAPLPSGASSQSSSLESASGRMDGERPRSSREQSSHPAYELGEIHLPEHAPMYYLGVGVIASLAAASLLVVGLLQWLPMIIAITIPGLCILGCGGCLGYRHLTRAGLDPFESPGEAREALEHMERLVGRLDEAASPLTVEELQTRLDWSESKVVSTLKRAIDRGRVLEDLDVDSGHWTYQIDRSEALGDDVREALPVDERAERLESRDH